MTRNGIRRAAARGRGVSRAEERHLFDAVEFNRKFKKIKNRFFLPRFLREMKKLRIGGISGGNGIKLITGGDACFDEILKAIRSARKSINLETYIFKSDSIGWTLARSLVKKARAGVEVNVVYDAVGSLGTSSAMFSFMRGGGVEVIEYHPLAPWRRYWNISLRDHRKILVVDGRIAFLGGINIGLEYAGHKYGGGGWRDTHLKIEGPAVRDVQFFFMENWYRNGGAIVESSRHFPHMSDAGDRLVMILSTRSRKKIKPVHQSYLSAINFARETIYITNAYFIPDARIYRALVRAAGRGVDVRVLLPGVSDMPFVHHASRYLYKRYLKNGIRVYEYQKSVLHAKTACIDGIWSTVGSSNMDRRSFLWNLEINAIILDQEFGEEMEKVFSADLRRSRELKLEDWHKRSALSFLREWFWYRFRNWL